MPDQTDPEGFAAGIRRTTPEGLDDSILRSILADGDATELTAVSMAEELLAARARITELEAEAQADERAIEEARDERDAARDRAAELEAAPVAELIGYAVLGHSTEILGDQNLTREWTEERAQWWRDRGWDARVVELREVTDHG